MPALEKHVNQTQRLRLWNLHALDKERQMQEAALAAQALETEAKTKALEANEKNQEAR